MTENTLTLDGKEYQIDIQKAKELGVIKEKDTRCKSWEEFHKKYSTQERYFYAPTIACAQLTREEAIAIHAFSKLLKLRRDWIGDWESDLKSDEYRFCIIASCDIIKIAKFRINHHAFSFPTEEMAVEFLNCFNYLFEDCKFLI